MRKRIFMITIMAGMLLLFQASAFGADVAKIGVLDFQRVLMTSSEGKKAQAEINAHGKKLEADLKAKGGEIEQLKSQLEREALVISKAQRDEKERNIRIKINDLKVLQQKYSQDFKAEEQRLVAQIQKGVNDIIQEMGEKEGYLLIVERRQGGILYYPQAIDITDRVIMEFNARSAKGTAAQ